MPAAITTITLNPAIDQTVAIPNFKSGAVNRVIWEQTDPGGKGINVAAFLADFGFAVTVSGFLGAENSQLFQNFFTNKGITDRFIYIPGRTRTNVKVIDQVQDQITDINFPGPSPTAQHLATLHDLISKLADQDWFILSGSLPTGVTPNIYAEFTHQLKAQGKTVVLDASGESLQQAIAAQPSIIKPNLTEFEELVGHSLSSETDVVQAARELVADGIACVVVSMGAAGAIFVEAKSAVWAKPPQVEVVTTVGAGDAMVAGLVTAKLRGLPLADGARLATAFSLAALSQVGPRLPPPDLIEATMAQVQLESLV